MPAADRPAPRLFVKPPVVRHGEIVILSAQGLEPYERLDVQGRATETGDRVRHQVRTDRSGRIDAAVRLPDLGDCSQVWVFKAETAGREVSLIAGDVLVRASLH